MTWYADTAGTIREIDAALVAAWVAAGNPKAVGLVELPPRPSDAHEWSGTAWVLPPEPVPASVSPYQFRVWLIRAGVSLAQVDAMIDALPQPDRDEARVAWEYGLEVRRDHPLIGQFGASLGMDAAAIDAAFREASEVA
jgi:hypothetical protein